MEISSEKFEDLIAQRLLTQAAELVGDTVKRTDKVEQEVIAVKPQTVVVAENTLPATDFVKVEKNLTSFGFFTPSSKKIRNAKAKVISFTRVIDGKRIEAKV